MSFSLPDFSIMNTEIIPKVIHAYIFDSMIVRTALNENLAKIFGSANRKLTVFRSDCFPFCVVLLLFFISLISSIYTF